MPTSSMVELDSEGDLSRSEVAAFLREFADELDDGDVGTLHDAGTGIEDEPDVIGEPPSESDRAQRQEERAEATRTDAKRITLIVGGDSATVSVPEALEFDVEVASRSPMLSSTVDQAIEFELSWKIENPDDLDEEWIEVE